MKSQWEQIDPNTWTCRGLLVKRVFEDGATLFHVMHQSKVVATGYDLEDAQAKAKDVGGWGAT